MAGVGDENAPVYATDGRIHRIEESKENANSLLSFTAIIASRFHIFWDAAPRALLSTRLVKYSPRRCALIRRLAERGPNYAFFSLLEQIMADASTKTMSSF
jgi:hypothetical protein